MALAKKPSTLFHSVPVMNAAEPADAVAMFVVVQAKSKMCGRTSMEMSNKPRQIRPMEVQKPDPIFEACRLKTAPGWYVRVSWRYGQMEHVSGFASEQDAESWINKKSAGWLRNRAAALRS